MKSRKAKAVGAFAAAALVAVLIVAWNHRRELWFEFRLWQDFTSIGTNTQGYREYRHRATGIVFVRLPGGRSLLGSPAGEEWRGTDEGPLREVGLSPFLIAKFETTQAQWQDVTGGNPAHFQGRQAPDVDSGVLPVERVSWDDCQAFCESTGLCLPTEEQWEYACRAGTETPFSVGESITAEQANYNGNPWPSFAATKENRQRTLPVGSFPANPFGLHDMHGNVGEWCTDTYDGRPGVGSAAQREGTERRSDPTLRVVRGGGWDSFGADCRSAGREAFHADVIARLSDVGVRLSWTPNRD